MPRADDRKPTSWTARVLAPLVLVAVVAAIILVISGTLSSDSNEKDSHQQSTTSEVCTPAADQAVKDGYYVVKAEDVTGLSGIAEKTCIPLETLVELNPNLDPQALQVDNCVDLVKDGCRKLTHGG